MNLDQLKQHWQQQAAPEAVNQQTLADLEAESVRLKRRLFWRDGIEITACIAVIIAFTSTLISAPNWLTGFGSVVVLGAAFLTIVQLLRARWAGRQQQADASILNQLRTEQARIQKQMRLLQGVLWWYVLPFAVGVICVFAGYAEAWWHTAIYALVVVLFGGWLVHINRQAALKTLSPQAERLATLIRQLEDTANTTE